MKISKSIVANMAFIILAVAHALTVQARVDMRDINQAFNFEILKDTKVYPLPIFPPIREEYAHVQPWSSIGNFKLSGVVFGWCTAFVVDINTIATAQHCLFYPRSVVDNTDGFVGRVTRIFRFDPKDPPTETSKIEYFANVFGGTGDLWQEQLKGIRVRSGKIFKKEDSGPTAENTIEDWAIVKLEGANRPDSPAMKKLNISPLSTAQLRSLYDKGDIQIFIASYPNSRLIPGFDNSYLRLTSQCLWLEIHPLILSLLCHTDKGSSGSPIMIRDQKGEISVIGVVSLGGGSMTYGRRLTLDMLRE